jgi:hypothetical protein
MRIATSKNKKWTETTPRLKLDTFEPSMEYTNEQVEEVSHRNESLCNDLIDNSLPIARQKALRTWKLEGSLSNR